MEKILGKAIWARIPSDYFVAVNALNKGVPFVISAPKNKMSLAYEEISQRILKGTDEPVGSDNVSPKGFFKRKRRDR